MNKTIKINKITKEELQDINENLLHGMTIRGKLLAQSILYNSKNIECRNKKIKHKYLALHLGSGKINPLLRKHLEKNFLKEDKKYKLPKGNIIGILKMGKSKELTELNEEELKNKWIYSEGGYKVITYIEKVYILKNPIKSRGFQCMNWKLECVDNNLKKKNKFKKSLKEKIIEELEKSI